MKLETLGPDPISADTHPGTRIVVVGDLHYRATTPRSRLDHNIQVTILNKLAQVKQKAQEIDAQYVIFTGDITDTPNLSIPAIVRLGIELQSMVQGTHMQDVPYTVPGNHDLYGNNPNTVARTAFGLLRGLGCFRDITESDSINLAGNRTCITGASYHPDMDTHHHTYRPSTCALDTGAHIHVVHGMLLEEEPHFTLRHTLIDEVAQDDGNCADIIICGHEHTGFGVVQRQGKVFVNPGALTRFSAHPQNFRRSVQIAILYIPSWSPEVLGVDLCPLDVQPAESVLTRDVLEQEHEREQRTEEFMRLLREGSESQHVVLEDIIRDIAARGQLPKNVVTDALQRISRARETLSE